MKHTRTTKKIKKTRKYKRSTIADRLSHVHSKSRRKMYQHGGTLCIGDTSLFKFDESVIIGKGQYGTVYPVVGDSNLCVKVQFMRLDNSSIYDSDGVSRKASQSDIQHELATAVIAGELGVGPRIYHLAMCDILASSPPVQKIIWVMDKITGTTIKELLTPQINDAYKLYHNKSITFEELEQLKEKIVEPYFKQVLPLIKQLNEKNIILNDIHEGNIMIGSIRGGSPKMWIIDYGHGQLLDSQIKINYAYADDVIDDSPYTQYPPVIFGTFENGIEYFNN